MNFDTFMCVGTIIKLWYMKDDDDETKLFAKLNYYHTDYGYIQKNTITICLPNTNKVKVGNIVSITACYDANRNLFKVDSYEVYIPYNLYTYDNINDIGKFALMQFSDYVKVIGMDKALDVGLKYYINKVCSHNDDPNNPIDNYKLNKFKFIGAEYTPNKTQKATMEEKKELKMVNRGKEVYQDVAKLYREYLITLELEKSRLLLYKLKYDSRVEEGKNDDEIIYYKSNLDKQETVVKKLEEEIVEYKKKIDRLASTYNDINTNILLYSFIYKWGDKEVCQKLHICYATVNSYKKAIRKDLNCISIDDILEEDKTPSI